MSGVQSFLHMALHAADEDLVFRGRVKQEHVAVPLYDHQLSTRGFFQLQVTCPA